MTSALQLSLNTGDDAKYPDSDPHRLGDELAEVATAATISSASRLSRNDYIADPAVGLVLSADFETKYSRLKDVFADIFRRYPSTPPPMKRFLNEAMLQLIQAASESLSSQNETKKYYNPYEKMTNPSKQTELIKQWITTAVSAQSLPLFVQAVIAILKHEFRFDDSMDPSGTGSRKTTPRSRHSAADLFRAPSLESPRFSIRKSGTGFSLAAFTGGGSTHRDTATADATSSAGTAGAESLSDMAGGTSDKRFGIQTSTLRKYSLFPGTGDGSGGADGSGDGDRSKDPRSLAKQERQKKELLSMHQSVCLIFIDTLTSVISQLLREKYSNTARVFTVAFDQEMPELIDALAEKATKEFSDDLRLSVGRLFGILSVKYLERICDFTIERWDIMRGRVSGLRSEKEKKLARKTECETYATVFHTILPYLRFDIDKSDVTKVRIRDQSVSYLMKLCWYMDGTEESVLRRAICESLMTIFETISPKIKRHHRKSKRTQTHYFLGKKSSKKGLDMIEGSSTQDSKRTSASGLAQTGLGSSGSSARTSAARSGLVFVPEQASADEVTVDDEEEFKYGQSEDITDLVSKFRVMSPSVGSGITRLGSDRSSGASTIRAGLAVTRAVDSQVDQSSHGGSNSRRIPSIGGTKSIGLPELLERERHRALSPSPDVSLVAAQSSASPGMILPHTDSMETDASGQSTSGKTTPADGSTPRTSAVALTSAQMAASSSTLVSSVSSVPTPAASSSSSAAAAATATAVGSGAATGSGSGSGGTPASVAFSSPHSVVPLSVLNRENTPSEESTTTTTSRSRIISVINAPGRQAVQRRCPPDDDDMYWMLYYNIFNIINEWALVRTETTFGRGRTTLDKSWFHYIRLMIRMICCGNEAFFFHGMKYEPQSKSGYVLPKSHKESLAKSGGLKGRPSLKVIQSGRLGGSDDPSALFNLSPAKSGALSSSSKKKTTDRQSSDIADRPALEDTGSGGGSGGGSGRRSVVPEPTPTLPPTPWKSYIIRTMLTRLEQNEQRLSSLGLMVQLVSELPEDFIRIDPAWYKSMLDLFKECALGCASDWPLRETAELNLVADLFCAYAERNPVEYFLPLMSELLNPEESPEIEILIGLWTLKKLVSKFDHVYLERFNHVLGPLLNPYVTEKRRLDMSISRIVSDRRGGINARLFLHCALECWPSIRSPTDHVENIHKEMTIMVDFIQETDAMISNLAKQNLRLYVTRDFGRHLIPVVSSLISPMRDVVRFRDKFLNAVKLLNQIAEALEQFLVDNSNRVKEALLFGPPLMIPNLRHGSSGAKSSMRRRSEPRPQSLSNRRRSATVGSPLGLINRSSDKPSSVTTPAASKDAAIGASGSSSSTTTKPPAAASSGLSSSSTVKPTVTITTSAMDKPDIGVLYRKSTRAIIKSDRYLTSGAEDSDEDDDEDESMTEVENQFEQAVNAIKDEWPHVRQLIEGYILLWYCHPDEHTKEILFGLLKRINSKVFRKYIDSDEYISIFDAMNAEHFEFLYGFDPNAEDLSASRGIVQSSRLPGSSNHSKLNPHSELMRRTGAFGMRSRVDGFITNKRLMRSEHLGESSARYNSKFGLQDGLIYLLSDDSDVRKYEGILNWAFRRLIPRLPYFFAEIIHVSTERQRVGDAFDNDSEKFKLWHNLWHLMCWTVRYDDEFFNDRVGVATTADSTTAVVGQGGVNKSGSSARNKGAGKSGGAGISRIPRSMGDISEEDDSELDSDFEFGNGMDSEDEKKQTELEVRSVFEKSLRKTRNERNQKHRRKNRRKGRGHSSRNSRLHQGSDLNGGVGSSGKAADASGRLAQSARVDVSESVLYPSFESVYLDGGDDFMFDGLIGSSGGILAGSSGIKAHDMYNEWIQSGHTGGGGSAATAASSMITAGGIGGGGGGGIGFGGINIPSHSMTHGNRGFYNPSKLSISFQYEMYDTRLDADDVLIFFNQIEKLLTDSQDDSYFQSMIDPLRSMSARVCERLILHLYRRFENADDSPSWKEQVTVNFYLKNTYLHLFAIIFTNRYVCSESDEHCFYDSDVFNTTLQKLILCIVYNVDKSSVLYQLHDYPKKALYMVTLLTQFFHFYRNREPQFDFCPYLDNPNLGSALRARLSKRPLPLSETRARKNLLDFLNNWYMELPRQIAAKLSGNREYYYDLHHSRSTTVTQHTTRVQNGAAIGRRMITTVAAAGTGRMVGVGSSSSSSAAVSSAPDSSSSSSSPMYPRVRLKFKEVMTINKHLTIEIAQCLVALVNLGSIGDEHLEKLLLTALEEMILTSNGADGESSIPDEYSGSHTFHSMSEAVASVGSVAMESGNSSLLSRTAQKGLTAIFRHNPQLLEHFVEQSCRLHFYYHEFVSLGLSDTEMMNMSSANLLPAASVGPGAAVPTLSVRRHGGPLGMSGDDSMEIYNDSALLSIADHKLKSKKQQRGDTTIKLKQRSTTIVSQRQSSTVTAVSLAYLHALVTNFRRDIQSYYARGLKPVTALLLSMLHQCSPHQEARKLAQRLAKTMIIQGKQSELLSDEKEKQLFRAHCFSPGDDFEFDDRIAPDEYLKMAFSYCERVSENSFIILPKLMYEVHVFYDRVKSEYDREVLLRILESWVNRFLLMIDKFDNPMDRRAKIRSIIEDLYQLNIKALSSPRQLILCNTLWEKLPTLPLNLKGSVRTVDLLLDELIAELVLKITVHFSESTDEKDRMICHRILETVDRVTEHRYVATYLCKNLHQYNDQCPNKPEEFMDARKKFGKKNKISTASPEQKAAFILTHSLLQIRHEPFEHFTPLILQNAAVIFGADREWRDIVAKLAEYFCVTRSKKVRSKTMTVDHGGIKLGVVDDHSGLSTGDELTAVVVGSGGGGGLAIGGGSLASSSSAHPSISRKKSHEQESGHSRRHDSSGVSLTHTPQVTDHSGARLTAPKSLIKHWRSSSTGSGSVSGLSFIGGKYSHRKKKSWLSQDIPGIDIWRDQRPYISVAWSSVAIGWALQSHNGEIATRSITVFEELGCFDLSYELLIQLTLLCHVGLTNNYPNQVFLSVLKILLACQDESLGYLSDVGPSGRAGSSSLGPETVTDASSLTGAGSGGSGIKTIWHKREFKLAFLLGYTLLSMPHADIHKLALPLLNRFLAMKGPTKSSSYGGGPPSSVTTPQLEMVDAASPITPATKVGSITEAVEAATHSHSPHLRSADSSGGAAAAASGGGYCTGSTGAGHSHSGTSYGSGAGFGVIPDEFNVDFDVFDTIRQMEPVLRMEEKSVDQGIYGMIENSLVRQELFPECSQFVRYLAMVFAPTLEIEKNVLFHLSFLALSIEFQEKVSLYAGSLKESDLMKHLKIDELISLMECYPEKCSGLAELCRNIGEFTSIKSYTDFSKRLCYKFFRIFKSDDSVFIHYIRLLCRFFEYGRPKWHFVVLKVLEIALRVSPHGLSRQIFNEISEGLVTASFLTNHAEFVEFISKIALTIMTRDQSLELPDQSVSMFQFVHPLPKSVTRLRYYSSKNKKLCEPKDEDECLKRCKERLVKYLFGDLRSAVMKEWVPRHMHSTSSIGGGNAIKLFNDRSLPSLAQLRAKDSASSLTGTVFGSGTGGPGMSLLSSSPSGRSGQTPTMVGHTATTFIHSSTSPAGMAHHQMSATMITNGSGSNPPTSMSMTVLTRQGSVIGPGRSPVPPPEVSESYSESTVRHPHAPHPPHSGAMGSSSSAVKRSKLASADLESADDDREESLSLSLSESAAMTFTPGSYAMHTTVISPPVGVSSSGTSQLKPHHELAGPSGSSATSSSSTLDSKSKFLASIPSGRMLIGDQDGDDEEDDYDDDHIGQSRAIHVVQDSMGLNAVSITPMPSASVSTGSAEVSLLDPESRRIDEEEQKQDAYSIAATVSSSVSIPETEAVVSDASVPPPKDLSRRESSAPLADRQGTTVINEDDSAAGLASRSPSLGQVAESVDDEEDDHFGDFDAGVTSDFTSDFSTNL